MSGIDLKQIEKNYSLKEDYEIERIATSKSHGLRPEVYQIIENEIKKRSLNPNLLQGVIAQNREYSIDEIIEFSRVLRCLPCPYCGSKAKKLNGVFIYKIKSFILFTYTEVKKYVACSECLDSKCTKAIVSNLFLGWWGFPMGLIKTPFYIYKNFNSKSNHRISNSNDALISFVESNIGYIESYKDDEVKLKTLINQ
ncbi:hypothetical protein [Flavobacterium sp.]|jgi:hypothetical protein|uniref:hypothetical protein n=1 Tax=Flavobacterium sp. TaxID=239 RepID=UPI002A839A91|nr:hypothetical protein [Flavobacterium sp.]